MAVFLCNDIILGTRYVKKKRNYVPVETMFMENL